MREISTDGPTTRERYNAFSSGYDRFLYPLERLALARVRRRLIPLSRGRILELAVGTGVNLPLYPADSCVTALDLSDGALQHARRRAAHLSADLVQADAGRLPFRTEQFDTVISTLLYCSLDDPAAMLSEVRRVLRPDGQLLMLEHVRGGTPVVGALTDALNVPWHAITRSCRLNRQPAGDLAAAGFEIVEETRSALTIIQSIVARPLD